MTMITITNSSHSSKSVMVMLSSDKPVLMMSQVRAILVDRHTAYFPYFVFSGEVLDVVNPVNKDQLKGADVSEHLSQRERSLLTARGLLQISQLPAHNRKVGYVKIA